MRYQFVILLILPAILISCNQNTFPEPVTQKVNQDIIKLNDEFFETEVANRDSISGKKKYDFRLDNLMSFLKEICLRGKLKTLPNRMFLQSMLITFM